MTYKSRTRGNAVLLDSEVLEASQKATGIDPMIAIREKYPDAELIFSTPERFPFDAQRQLEDFKRGYHDEMTYYDVPDERFRQTLPFVIGHDNMPIIFEGELERLAHMRSTPLVARAYHPFQEEAMRRITEMGTIAFDIESYARPSLMFSDNDFTFPIRNFKPLTIDPQHKKLSAKTLRGFFPQAVMYDEAHIWHRNPVRAELAWGLDIRYKFAREDGKTHAQICKQELKTIKKRRKAAMKQLDACCARYEAALKEEENAV